jgi:flagellin
MPQIINTNIASLTAQRNLNGSQSSLATSLQRLSTGLRINSARDDAAGLAISERFTTQIRGLNQAIRNANDGVSFAQTAEGALSTAGDALQRIRELAVQSINDTNSSSDRQSLNNEVQQLIAEVNRIATATQFNGQNILDGSLSTLTFQVGANQNQTIQVDGVDSRGSRLGADTASGEYVVLSDLRGATAATDTISINGQTVDVGASVDATTGDVNDLIDAINAVASDSGVSASQASSLSVDLTVVGVQIAVADPTDATAGATAIADSLNAVSGQTGVTATSSGATLTLNSSNGADITITEGAETLLSNVTSAAGETFQAALILATDVGADGAAASASYTISGAGTGLADTGLDGVTYARNILNDVDVLTGSTANDALQALDFALDNVNSLRAELGAVQTRFESTISNLSVTSENLSAARSRIRDADFAAETAELTRSQILQQAGIAILSQANALPQNVLALLQ